MNVRPGYVVTAAVFLLFLLSEMPARGQVVGQGLQPGPVLLVNAGDTMEEIVRKAANVVPSPRQMRWQEREFIAFVHFGMNTFTDREWGLGTEDPATFNPSDFDARQWVKVIKDAGMRMVIVTAKHHDGLCLWPSKFTDHSVKRSPWRGGKGDVVGEVAAACREFGLDFGIYLSPWDRHEPSYGDSPRYNEHFRNQLKELLTNYGEVAEVWFDGANGEGANGKKQEYDWPSYYRVIRELQPQAVIFGMGPDIRWVGTESGYGRETEWSVVPDVVQNLDAIAASSQQNPVDGAFVPGDLTGEDIGSRDKIKSAKALVWYPAETDVSIRPGWFYHAEQDDQVKTPEKLVDIYYSSVGRNSVLLLNIPPDKRGRIHENDIKSLMGMRRVLDQTFKTNLASSAAVTASNERAGHSARSVIDGDGTTYWSTEDGVESATLEITLPRETVVDRAMLQEYIRVGQRVERFRMESWNGTAWTLLARGTTIGQKRLLRFPAVPVTKVRLVFEQSRTSPTLSSFGLFKAPPRARIEPGGGAFQDSLRVRLSTGLKGTAIVYTLDGSEPTLTSQRYTGPIVLKRSTTLRAAPILQGAPGAELDEARFIKCLSVRSVDFEKSASARYSAGGVTTVIDGKRASADFNDAGWLGFEGDDVIGTIDLGQARTIRRITAGFLQQQGSWIFLPPQVVFSVSQDGTTWSSSAEINNPTEKSEKVLVRDFLGSFQTIKARYVRVSARNVGTCPAWHPGAGSKAWLFLDEIFIE
jgi:alpha-L-fucosidase